jgi:iron complex outermembrane receptor protein
MRILYNFQILNVVFNKHLLLSFVIILLFSCQLFAQGNGTINGHITDESTGEALIRVNVIISGTTIGAATDLDGNYTITKDDVVIDANQTVKLDVVLAATAVELGNVTVYGASRRNEKITEAPSAVSVIGMEEIRLKSNSGDVPKLLESQPGVDLAQSGVDDFNLNTRGFNSSVTRRVLVLLDGRDLGAAFLGQQEWGAISYPLEDVSNVEFVRGPGSALFGTNAFNGVLNISTFSPTQALGTKAKLSGGELSMFRVDIRNAGLLGAGFSYKINIGYLQSKNWNKNRITPPFEYPGLDPELREITDGSLKRTYGSARLDYQFAAGSIITAEGGITVVENDVIVTGIGRLNILKGVRPWGQLNYSSEHLYISAWGQSRTTPGSIFSLASGGELIENSTLYQIEGQYNYSFFQEKLRFVVGASQKIGHVDMEETAMVGTRDYTITGGYAQLEYKPLDQLKFVVTGRGDRSSYEKARFSPRLAAVWSFLPNHSLRVSFNKAFLLPSISEYFLRVLAGGADLSQLGINPGELTSVYAMGNTELVPERIEGYEVGYKGIFLDNRLFITLDGYVNKVRDFITDLLQGVNPAFPFNGAPAGLDSLIFYGSPENGIPALPGLTILPNGETAIVISYANKGLVNERGLELSFNYYLTNEFLISANWSYFDFDIEEQQEGDVLLPNNPKHKFGYSIRYTNPNGFDTEFSGRSSQAFDWAAGVFVGRIPEYHLFNLSAGYQITHRYRAGLTVTNLFDRQAYQIFGGSIVGRQLIASITVTL